MDEAGIEELLDELAERLGTPVSAVGSDGFAFIEAVFGL